MILLTDVGNELLDLVASAKSEITVIAPFIKIGVINKIVDCAPRGVKMSCITRWHPHEIKAGVSDIEIWDVLTAREHTRLFLIQTLHAKYYRADERYITGSSNLTYSALGWSVHPNIELMFSGRVDEDLRLWEADMFSQASEVDLSFVSYLKQLVDDLPEQKFILPYDTPGKEQPPVSEVPIVGSHRNSWLPMTRYPEQLYEAYIGRTRDMTTAARETATIDLLALAVPQGLDDVGFRAAVAAAVLQMPLIQELDRFLEQPRRFGAVRDHLESLHEYPSHKDATNDWQTAMRWLRFFLPTRYQVSVPGHSEVMFRIR